MSRDPKTQFINYMTLQRFALSTKKNYIAAFEGLAQFHQQSPETLTNEQIQEYLRYLIEDRKLSWGTCNNFFSGIVSFYRNVCKWDETRFSIPPRPRIKKLPRIFSIEEVKRLFASAANLKHRVLLKTIYSAGLRVSEVVRLQPDHLREYWCTYRPETWLFPGYKAEMHMCEGAAQTAFYKAKKKPA
jgi:site-specific recombinase XerD